MKSRSALFSLVVLAIGCSTDTHYKEAKETRFRLSAALFELADANAKGECPRFRTTQIDAWKTPIRIVCLSSIVRIVSAGPDREPGTADDIYVELPRGPFDGGL